MQDETAANGMVADALDDTTDPAFADALARDKAAHAPSYYADTLTHPVAFPPLTEARDVDVCIVGGGFTGVATAMFLAERGVSVALLEAKRIGWGATGRNGGQLIHGMSGSDAFIRQTGAAGRKFVDGISFRGNEIVADWVERYQIDCDLKWGWMLAATQEGHRTELDDEWTEIERGAEASGFAGNVAERFDAAETAKLLGTDAYQGSVVCWRSGHVHPLNLVRGEAETAAAIGAEVYENSPVLDVAHGTRPVVKTSEGQITANIVVLAGGAYHQLERRKLGGLVFGTNSYVLTTEPLGALADEINPRDIAVCDTAMVLDYFRLTADRRMLFGGQCHYSGREPSDIAGSLRRRMDELWPQLRDKRVDHAWGGKIGIVINRVPAFGKVAPNILYAQGYSGHGVNFGHVAGEILADASQGLLDQFDLLASVKHWQMPVPDWMAQPMLALGMSYYRIKDQL